MCGCPHRGPAIATKVLILAGDTDGNLGDLAIVTATCERLRSIDPASEIALLTTQPARDVARLGITPLRRGWRGLPALVQCARKADLVICGGGGLFQDDDSLAKMPYWAVRLAFLRMFSRRMAGLAIGAGPLDHPSSRLAARLALKALDPVSVRDPLARATLENLTPKNIRVVPDPAFMLNGSSADAARQVLADAGVPADKPLIGVSVRRWFHTNSRVLPHKYASKLGLYRNRGKQAMAEFVEATASVLNEIVVHDDAHVVFLPTYNVRHENDRDVCEAIAGKMPAGHASLVCLDDPKLYQSVTSLLAVMLCGRMHPAILAASRGTPVVGLAYNQKFFGMFSLLGQSTRCLSLKDFVAERQTEQLTRLLREAIACPAAAKPDTSALGKETASFIAELMTSAAAQPTAAAEPHVQHR